MQADGYLDLHGRSVGKVLFWMRGILGVPGAKLETFGKAGQRWTVPVEDLVRQATASLRGYIYQLHQSAAAWIKLEDSESLYLEIAEDFAALLREPDRIDAILQDTQVKDTRESGAVTLNSKDVIEAIQSLFRLRKNNQGREVRLNFLSTSEVGKERKEPLPSGTAGLVAWREAAQGGDVAEIRAALLARIKEDDLRTFIEESSNENLRRELLAPLTFACGAEDWQTIEEANRQALVELRDEVQSTVDMAYKAYDSVFAQLVKTLLSSTDRQLDRRKLLTCLEQATSIAIPSQVATKFRVTSTETTSASPMRLTDLIALAQALLDAGKPPSVALLFSSASLAARSALDSITASERTVVEMKAQGSEHAIATMLGLIERPELQHLIVGQPGAGKTHALWRTAGLLLASGKVVPLFLPAAQLSTWADLISLITDIAPDISPSTLLSDPRVCVCIDGWSEFAVGIQAGERRKALRVLHKTRVLANGKFVDAGDTIFKAWSLDLLTPDQVTQVLKGTRPKEPAPSQQVLDFLRLPLLLSIYSLSETQASAVGELLRQFHDHVAHGLPEAFTEALAESVADLSLAGDRSYGRLVSCLQSRARAKGVVDPIKYLTRLGTITQRGSQALPIHDLYWSWLAGHGLLAEGCAKIAVSQLHTRESYVLALQSGGSSSQSDVQAVIDDDLVLAATLEKGLRPHSVTILADALDRALSDARLAVRSRGGLAAIETREPAYLRRALNVLSELAQAGHHVPDWLAALQPESLFPLRATIADWLGSAGSDLLLDIIAERGGPEWVDWLEQVATTGAISSVDALATALGCGADFPKWGEASLEELVVSKPWKLRAVASRRSNVALAHRIAFNYDRWITTLVPQGSGAWFELNRVLVACGDEDVFRSLLLSFSAMGSRAQEILGFAVVDRGSPWVAHF